MRFGPFEIMILLAIFFLLFGAERLPKLARAAGQSKGEFQKGLNVGEHGRPVDVDLHQDVHQEQEHQRADVGPGQQERDRLRNILLDHHIGPVSYTHLTLPTNREV